MDHIENCLQFNWFFAAHLDTFNLFHRARSVIRGVSKNELQRRGLFYKKKGDILIKNHTERYESDTSAERYDGMAKGLCESP